MKFLQSRQSRFRKLCFSFIPIYIKFTTTLPQPKRTVSRWGRHLLLTIWQFSKMSQHTGYLCIILSSIWDRYSAKQLKYSKPFSQERSMQFQISRVVHICCLCLKSFVQSFPLLDDRRKPSKFHVVQRYRFVVIKNNLHI